MAMRIAVFAAMPQETGPIVRLDPGWHSIASEPFPTSILRSPEREALLVQTGIGRSAAAQAARQIAARGQAGPAMDLMLSVGFAGALSPDLTLGQLVFCSELRVLDERSGICAARYRCGRGTTRSTEASDFFIDHAVESAVFVTVDRLRSKAEIAPLVSHTRAVVEMESTAMADVAHELGIPFIGLRAISDEASFDIDLGLDSVMGKGGTIGLRELIPAVLFRPRLARSIPRLFRGSRLAGRNLAQMLASLPALPQQELLALACPPRPVHRG